MDNFELNSIKTKLLFDLKRTPSDMWDQIIFDALVETVESSRSATRSQRLVEFKTMALKTGGDAHAMRDTPGVPDDKIVRLCLGLIVEESVEIVRAVLADDHVIYEAEKLLVTAIERGRLKVNMVEFADALEDTDYVVQNAREAFGIDGEPIAAIVHRKNMEKAAGPIDSDTGKKLKPPGWVGPEKEIEAELRRQGWQG